jgi:hypothetical protein
VLGALILAAVTVDFVVGKRLRKASVSESRRGPTAGVPPPQGAAADA